MLRLLILFIIGIFLIDAAFMGNLGSMIGAVIDPLNMIDLSGSAGSSNNFGGTQ